MNLAVKLTVWIKCSEEFAQGLGESLQESAEKFVTEAGYELGAEGVETHVEIKDSVIAALEDDLVCNAAVVARKMQEVEAMRAEGKNDDEVWEATFGPFEDEESGPISVPLTDAELADWLNGKNDEEEEVDDDDEES